jgi:hypothetical protein
MEEKEILETYGEAGLALIKQYIAANNERKRLEAQLQNDLDLYVDLDEDEDVEAQLYAIYDFSGRLILTL